MDTRRFLPVLPSLVVAGLLVSGNSRSEEVVPPAPPAPAEPAAPPAPPAPGSLTAEELAAAQAKLEATRAELKALAEQLQTVSTVSQASVEEALRLLKLGQASQVENEAQPTLPPQLVELRTALTALESDYDRVGAKLGEDFDAEEFKGILDNLRVQVADAVAQGDNWQTALQVSKDEARQLEQNWKGVEKAIRDLARELRDAERATREDHHASSLEVDPEDGRAILKGDGQVKAGEKVKEFVIFSGNGEISGEVEHDAVVMAGNLSIRKGARVGGDVVLMSGNLSVEPDAWIGGDAVVMAGKMDIDPSAQIEGQRMEMISDPVNLPLLQAKLAKLEGLKEGNLEIQLSQDHDDEDHHHAEGGFVSNFFHNFMLLTASGLVLMSFFPLRLQEVTRTLTGRVGASTVMGVLASFGTVGLSLLLVISLFGIPMLPVLGVVMIAAVVMGFCAITLELGRQLPLKRRGPLTVLAAGAAVLSLLLAIPVLGGVVAVLVGLTGLGAVLLSRFGHSDGAIPEG